jgi:hypothetical protein
MGVMAFSCRTLILTWRNPGLTIRITIWETLVQLEKNRQKNGENYRMKSFMICILRQTLLAWSKGDEHLALEEPERQLEDVQGGHHLGDLGVAGRIILK